jgi:hypothetical protein
MKGLTTIISILKQQQAVRLYGPAKMVFAKLIETPSSHRNFITLPQSKWTIGIR